jgi:DNA-binding Lrp family transcriptional regulator
VTVTIAAFTAVRAWIPLAVGGLLVVATLVWIELRYRVWAFEVREDALYLERGVVTREEVEELRSTAHRRLADAHDELKAAIGDVEGVADVHIVAGDVDLIAKIEVESPPDVKRIAAEGIHDIEGVDSTQTYIAMD